MIITSDEGPMLVGGDPPVLLRDSPPLWVPTAADGIPTAIVEV